MKNSIDSNAISARSDIYGPACYDLANDIWDRPELAFQESYAYKLQADFLAQHGFKITHNIGGIPTAFMAEAGESGPTIGFLGEFDALAALSQDANKIEKSATKPDANGHGCGHHLLGSASILAALVTRDLVRSAGLPGRIRYYGCPAEESGSGKTFMLRSGAFSGLDAALSWHPHDTTYALYGSWMANVQAYFRFYGRSSHASSDPAMGRSALDAVELMNIGVNFLREHMEADCRVHYAITNPGGISANVIPSFAEVVYIVRGRDNEAASDLFARVKKIGEGAALMTETKMEMVLETATSSLLPNRVLSELMHEHLMTFGAPKFDEADLKFAADLQKTMEAREIRASLATRSGRGGSALFGEILPLTPKEILLPVSGDIGDVSWTTPTAQCLTACYAVGSQLHSWQVVAQGKAPAAHKGMTLAAKTMAATAISVLADPEILVRAKDEWRQRGGESYRCPIPDEILPPPLRIANGLAKA